MISFAKSFQSCDVRIVLFHYPRYLFPSFFFLEPQLSSYLTSLDINDLEGFMPSPICVHVLQFVLDVKISSLSSLGSFVVKSFSQPFPIHSSQQNSYGNLKPHLRLRPLLGLWPTRRSISMISIGEKKLQNPQA